MNRLARHSGLDCACGTHHWLLIIAIEYHNDCEAFNSVLRDTSPYGVARNRLGECMCRPASVFGTMISALRYEILENRVREPRCVVQILGSDKFEDDEKTCMRGSEEWPVLRIAYQAFSFYDDQNHLPCHPIRDRWTSEDYPTPITVDTS